MFVKIWNIFKIQYKSSMSFIFIILITLIIVGPAIASQRLVLIESQINTSCMDSHDADQVLNQLVEDFPNYFVPVVYHAWWPAANDPYYMYNTVENYARIKYYPPHYDDFYYTPYAWIDGIIRGGRSFNLWESMILDRYYVDAPLEIHLSGHFDEVARTGNLRIKIIATGLIDWHLLKIRIALTEDSLYYQAPNGMLWHNFTMRDMIPDTSGIPLDISQADTLVFDQSFFCPDTLQLQFCKLVVWIQADDDSREILQTSRIRLDQLGPISVDHITGLPSELKLRQNYPNPFNASTTINYSLDIESRVVLEIYNLSARLVSTLTDEIQQAGKYQVIWNGLDSDCKTVASGIYFYRLSTDSKSLTRRMMLLK